MHTFGIARASVTSSDNIKQKDIVRWGCGAWPFGQDLHLFLQHTIGTIDYSLIHVSNNWYNNVINLIPSIIMQTKIWSLLIDEKVSRAPSWG